MFLKFYISHFFAIEVPPIFFDLLDLKELLQTIWYYHVLWKYSDGSELEDKYWWFRW